MVKIALIGVNGVLGSPFLEAFTDKKLAPYVEGPLVAVTHSESPAEPPAGVVYRKFSELKNVVKEVDVLISLVGPGSAWNTILHALEHPDSTVKLYVPSEFGYELSKVDAYLPILPYKAEHVSKVRKLGIKVVDTAVGFFIVPGKYLYEWTGVAGLDAKTRKLQYIGDTKVKIAVSAPIDIAKSIAVLLARPRTEIPDSIRIFSDEVTAEQIVKQWTNRHPDQPVDVQPRLDLEAATKEAQNRLKAGLKFEEFPFYLQVIAANGVDKGVSFSQHERELVNPNESLWKWTKY